LLSTARHWPAVGQEAAVICTVAPPLPKELQVEAGPVGSVEARTLPNMSPLTQSEVVGQPTPYKEPCEPPISACCQMPASGAVELTTSARFCG
jgi:hypothetical protein